MIDLLLKKDLIFFIPKISGVIFVHPANRFISVKQLLQTQERLVKKNINDVVYVENRRTKLRQEWDIPTDFLSRFGRVYQDCH